MAKLPDKFKWLGWPILILYLPFGVCIAIVRIIIDLIKNIDFPKKSNKRIDINDVRFFELLPILNNMISEIQNNNMPNNPLYKMRLIVIQAIKNIIKGRNRKAISLLIKSLKIINKNGDCIQEIIILKSIGIAYFGLNKFNKCIEYNKMALTVFEKHFSNQTYIMPVVDLPILVSSHNGENYKTSIFKINNNDIFIKIRPNIFDPNSNDQINEKYQNIWTWDFECLYWIAGAFLRLSNIDESFKCIEKIFEISFERKLLYAPSRIQSLLVLACIPVFKLKNNFKYKQEIETFGLQLTILKSTIN
jgi:tetratricopeptide (TPR) repeat protein